MTDRTAELGRAALGERLGGFIYGTIVTLSVIAAAASSVEQPGRIAVLVVVTTSVFWLSHVYAHALANSVSRDERLALADVRRIARREASILEAAAPPVAALLLGWLGVIEASSSIWLALALGLAILALQGLLFARVERLGVLATLVVVAVNLGLGLVIVALKQLIGHY